MSFIKNAFITKKFRSSIVATVFLLAFFASHSFAHAATLSISPSSGTITVGKTFTARVLVNGGGQSINGVSGKVTFSTDTLQLTGVSKTGIITLWAQDPSYSNSSGSASFQGVILNGYSGSGGTVVTLTFKAKAAGTGTVSISQGSSSVLLNDGNGTDVLSGTSGASFTIGGTAATTPVPTKTDTVTKPETPVTTTPETVPVTPPVEVPASPGGPLFTDYQSPLLPDNFVVVKGTGDKNSLIFLTVTHTDPTGMTTVSQIELPTTADGLFTYVSDEKVAQGNKYSLVATNTSGQSTAPLMLKVRNSIWYVLCSWIAAVVAVKMSIALAVVITALITLYLLYRNRELRRRLRAASR